REDNNNNNNKKKKKKDGMALLLVNTWVGERRYENMGTVAILISMGALLGRVTPSQLLLMALIEVPLYAINFYIVHHYLRMTDAGGSATIHVFGCYFGLAASLIIGKPEHMTPSTSIYHSELLTMIGTLFLWLYFPSFNAYFAYAAPIQESGYDGLRRQSDRTRAFVNTVIALCASTIAAFIVSKCNRKGKINMTYIQNATLAGGVAMGACADLYTNPAGAVAIGFFAGVLSTIGFKLYETACPSVGLYDTRGVNNLHGMPGILGCVASAITVGSFNDKSRYRRDMHHQGAYQIAGLCVTFGIAVVGGLITGLLMKVLPSPKVAYNDSEHFIVAETDYYYGTIRGKQKGASD
ncbi:ammonium transporter Rh type A, partial [Reticulomyxa filosa]